MGNLAVWFVLASGLALGLACAGSGADKPKTQPKPNAQMQAVLDAFATLNPKPTATLTVAEARKRPTSTDAVKALLKKQGKSTDPEPVGDVKNVLYTGVGGKMSARVYTPKGEGPFPVLVFWHGGGWVLADLDYDDATCRALCNAAGCVVVSCEYRHAPEHPFPAPMDDAFAAYQWVLKSAADLGGDPKRVAVSGESAGGNLAAVTALRARDQGVPIPVYQLLIYPILNNAFDTPSYRNNWSPFLDKAAMEWFWGKYLTNPADGANPYASPLRAKDLSKLPPAMIVSAEIDPLRSEGKEYADRLRKAGVDVTHLDFPGVTHKFFGMTAVLDDAKDAVAKAAKGLKAGFQK